MDPSLDPRWPRRRRWRSALAALALLLLAVGVWHQVEPLPPGVHVAGPWRTVDAGQVEVLFDRTYRDAAGRTVPDHRIFDHVFELIDRAERLVVIDMFLFNDFAGAAGEGFRPLSDQLTERLLEKRRERPGIDLLLITDPINAHYGGRPSRHVDRLRAGGVQVVYTDLERLRDSNPLWSTPWRVALQWFGNSTRGGWLPSPFDPEAAVTLRTYFALLNFKANHRKVVVADDPDGGLVALATSANPHDASSRHSNVAALVRGSLARDVLASELRVARFSGWRGRITPPPATAPPPLVTPVRVRFVTEGAIRDGVLDALAAASAGDRIDLAMFYLSHRDVIGGLLAAARRGARVRLVLDPNRDAFGREKDGIPNRSVAHELVTRGRGNVEVRWYRTDGEQFHTKLTVVRAGGVARASLGSANLTRRNVDDLNLEANVELEAPLGSALDRALAANFERLWSNRDGTFTDPYDRWADPSRWQAFKYRVMESTGLSTF
ncbi:MAG TPA: phospholipase D-like domain-containing protein [Thermoanaerobaculia bacterium]|nr:phospholipase D-like domain-containing protein [Thermoanaerobaculia bacterium]